MYRAFAGVTLQRMPGWKAEKRGAGVVIEIVNKRITIDGRPRILMAGEIHYYRVARTDWADRIAKLQETGCNTVASYIPWLLRERADGTFDLEGRTEANLDLGGFIDLCHEHGLWFLARPGPF